MQRYSCGRLIWLQWPLCLITQCHRLFSDQQSFTKFILIYKLNRQQTLQVEKAKFLHSSTHESLICERKRERISFLSIVQFKKKRKLVKVFLLIKSKLTSHNNFVIFHLIRFKSRDPLSAELCNLLLTNLKFLRSHSSNLSLQEQEIWMRIVDIVRPEWRQANGLMLGWNDLELLRWSGNKRSSRWRIISAWFHKQCEWVLHFLS